MAFIGDGTNDSPALARADVGFAMAGGTDIAIEAGDIVLCRNDLSSMATAMHLARTTMRRIKINYFWALSYNTVLIPISAGVLFPSYHFALIPMIAAGAMALSSVCIVLSSLLLLLYKPPRLYGAVAPTVTQNIGKCGAPEEAVVDSSHAVTVAHCQCPASLAPTLLLQDGPLRRAGRQMMEIWLSLASPLADRDPNQGALSTEIPPAEEDLEGSPGVMDVHLSDVEKFLRTDMSEDFFKGKGSEISSKTKSMNAFYVSWPTRSKTLRKRKSVSTVRMPPAGKKCTSCAAPNCRCSSDCNCGAK